MNARDAILVVEDEPDALTLLQHAFAAAGITHPLHAVHDGENALAYLRGEGVYADRAVYPSPSLLLLDLKIPGSSGFEVLESIRREPSFAALPVVILTSSRERRDVQRAYAAGANSYLVKPSSLKRLTEMARAFRDYWLVHNEGPPMS
ncbi:MAG TPA: response regulator [Opitutus sp.]|nr:response regulator [Opitutus sp.]